MKTSRLLWQYYRDESFIDNNGAIIDVPDNSVNASFKYKKVTHQTGSDVTKYIQIMVPLKYLSND